MFISFPFSVFSDVGTRVVIMNKERSTFGTVAAQFIHFHTKQFITEFGTEQPSSPNSTSCAFEKMTRKYQMMEVLYFTRTYFHMTSKFR
jgi:hypothetical protein